MRAKLWGVRGSVPVPGPATQRFGGNTSCVQVTAEDGSEFVLDAGTGIRELGAGIAGRSRRIHVLLTHLHLDHIQGLMFFAPFFDPEVEITVWGPPAAGRTLRKRLARYISSPLSPIEIGELPARVTFRDVPTEPWRIGAVELRASLVSHRGPTLGYRLSENGTSLCYLPDHEPALGQDLRAAPTGWISGGGLARRASLLIHDAQYSQREYPAHRGWGHSSLPDALTFASRCDAQRLLLFHHDPSHDDAFLDALSREASDRWSQLGGQGSVDLAREGELLDLANTPPPDGHLCPWSRRTRSVTMKA
jgi:phosphoribosyl 1,2-cyclic phosphodiesterase